MRRSRAVVLAVAAVATAGLAGSAQTHRYRPVTAAMLLNPDPDDWLHFRRTYDHQGYSPLAQINGQNVHQLQLVWSWQQHTGTTEGTPQVHDGVMFINNASGSVQALDAVTGDLLWDYQVSSDPTAARRVTDPGVIGRESVGGGGIGNQARPTSPIRNLALWGDKVFTGTDGRNGSRLIALKALTGEVVWEKKVGYGFSAGPLVVNGKVIASSTNCEFYKEEDPCFIAAHDAESGTELWRTHTIQRLGDPGPDTWSGLPNTFRAGGDNYQVGSYDPKTNLTYWGTAQAKPWIPYQRGTNGAALYTNSTLALDVETGKLRWYFQHIPAESFDMDETFERILIDYNGRSSSFSMGKIGILWELDRRTGQYRNAYDLGYQDQGHIDPGTGQLVYDRTAQQGVPLSFCPGISGFKSWRAMAYHPKTEALYVPLLLYCNTATPGPIPERKIGGGGVAGFHGYKSFLHPKSLDGVGEFAAIDIKTGKIIWRHRSKTPPSSSALATAGGLVVMGNRDRNVYFYDAENGTILHQIRLPGPPVGTPTTYMVAGRQYIAIPLGTGSQGAWTTMADNLLPEVRGKNLSWDMFPNGVYVFALPAK